TRHARWSFRSPFRGRSRIGRRCPGTPLTLDAASASAMWMPSHANRPTASARSRWRRRPELRVGFVLFAAAAAVSAAVAAATVPVSTAAAPERVVQVTARRFSYEPSFIELEAGVPVIIELTSLDRDHGFNIPDLGVRVDVAAGKTVRVRIGPDKA